MYKNTVIFSDEVLRTGFIDVYQDFLGAKGNLTEQFKGDNKALSKLDDWFAIFQGAQSVVQSLIKLRTAPGVNLQVLYIKGNGNPTDLAFAKSVAAANTKGYYIYMGHGTGTLQKGGAVGVSQNNVTAIKTALSKVNPSTKVFFSCCFPTPINQAVPKNSQMDISGLKDVDYGYNTGFLRKFMSAFRKAVGLPETPELKDIDFPITAPWVLGALFLPMKQINQAAAQAAKNGEKINVNIYFSDFQQRPAGSVFSAQNRFDKWTWFNLR